MYIYTEEDDRSFAAEAAARTQYEKGYRAGYADGKKCIDKDPSDMMMKFICQQETIAELNSIIVSQKKMEDKYNRYYNLVGDLYEFLVRKEFIKEFTSFHEDREIHRVAQLKKIILEESKNEKK